MLRKEIFAIFLIFFCLMPVLVLANDNDECDPCAGVPGVCIPNPLEACTFEDLLESIVNFIFWVSAAIVPIMIVIAGFYFLTAAGDPKKISTGRQIILWAVIGFAIVLFAKGIVSVVKGILGV